jgi:cyanophycinase
VELAGGSEARIVVIPTATSDKGLPLDWPGVKPFRDAGAMWVTVLHTRYSDVANTEDFVQPLRQATGVWIEGGRPWRLVEAYLGTLTEDELHLLLARGGVIGGTSAGASMMASFLLRGDVKGNDIVWSPEYQEGFGFLRGVAVDQHLLAREREADMFQVLRQNPELLGIGLSEGSAIVVRGDLAEILGAGPVAFYDRGEPDHLFHWLWPGEVYDLADRHQEPDALNGGPPGGI